MLVATFGIMKIMLAVNVLPDGINHLLDARQLILSAINMIKQEVVLPVIKDMI